MNCHINGLEDAIEKSKKGVLLFPLDYNEFIENQKIVRDLLGESGFIMFTDNRAVLCMWRVPNLRILINREKVYEKKDFEKLLLKNIEIIGSDINKKFRIWRQYLEDIKDNLKWIAIIAVIYFSIYHFNNIRIDDLVSLGENLLNVMGIFISMVFVFIGFIYSDSDRVIETNLKGIGDNYYTINNYIMNLSITIILLLLFSISLGGMTKEELPDFLVILQQKWRYLDFIISRKMQYLICQLVTFFSICSMTICFKSLLDYYFKDLKNTFFIASIEKKVRENGEKR